MKALVDLHERLNEIYDEIAQLPLSSQAKSAMVMEIVGSTVKIKERCITLLPLPEINTKEIDNEK